MDRQALLQQKRQRLQELKLRRAPDAARVDEVAARLGVSVAVQTAPREAPGATAAASAPTPASRAPTSRISYDKGIQVTPLIEAEAAEAAEAEAATEAATEAAAEPAAELNEDALNASLAHSLKTLSRIVLAAEPEEGARARAGADRRHGHADAAATAAVAVAPLPSAGRAVGDIDVAEDGAVVVAYAEAGATESGDGGGAYERVRRSPGLAVVYHPLGGGDARRLAPASYLVASAAITAVRFDAGSADTVMGGLASGRVVVWEPRAEGTVVVLALLVSPVLSSSGAALIGRRRRDPAFATHAAPVVLLWQTASAEALDTRAAPFVTASPDGVVNLWSPRILASPRADSLKLWRGSGGSSGGGSGDADRRQRLSVGCVALLRGAPASWARAVVVGGSDGWVYRVGNDGAVYGDSAAGVDGNDGAYGADVSRARGAVSSIVELHAAPGDGPGPSLLLVTTSHEFGVRLWRTGAVAAGRASDAMSELTVSPLRFVAAPYLVTRVLARPHSPLEFVTLGIGPDAGSPSPAAMVSLWRLDASLAARATELAVPKAHSLAVATSLRFAASGQRLYVGFSDGAVVEWTL